MTSHDDDSLLRAEMEADKDLSLEELISKYSPTPHELEMQAQALARLKEECSSTPWYVEQAERDGEIFWERLFSKAPLEYRDDLRALKKR